MNVIRWTVSYLLFAMIGTAAAQQSIILEELETKLDGKFQWDKSKRRIVGLQLNCNKLVPIDVVEQFRRQKPTDLNTITIKKADMTEKQLANFSDFLEKGRFTETEINLSATEVNLEWLSKLEKGLRHVKGLNLSFTEITDKELAKVNEFTQLTKLDLTGTKIEDVGKINALRDLKELSLRLTAVSDSSLSSLRKNQTRLTKLDLGQLRNLTDKGIQELTKSEKKTSEQTVLIALTHLNLSYSNLTIEGVKELTKLKSLTHLDLSYSNLEDGGVEELTKLENLKNLNLSYCRGVTDKSIAVLKNLKKLSQVGLTGTQIREDKRIQLKEQLLHAASKP